MESMDAENDAYWDEYLALSTREQIRRDGFSAWMCRTNKGVLTTVVLTLLAGWVVLTLLGY